MQKVVLPKSIPSSSFSFFFLSTRLCCVLRPLLCWVLPCGRVLGGETGVEVVTAPPAPGLLRQGLLCTLFSAHKMEELERNFQPPRPPWRSVKGWADGAGNPSPSAAVRSRRPSPRTAPSELCRETETDALGRSCIRVGHRLGLQALFLCLK